MGFSRFLGRKARRPLVFAAVLMFLGAAGAVLAAPSVTTFAQTTPGIVETPEVAVTLVFSENVTNVDSTDFAVLDGTFTPVGAGGPAVSAVSGSGRDYSVTFDSNGQTGFFFLQVDASNDIVSSPGGEALEPTGLSVFVRFAGERPYVTAFDTGGGTSNFPEFALSFSRDVTNVDPTDFLVFSAAKAGPGEPFVTTVTGGPRDYRVTVDANSSSGTYQVFIEPTNDIVSSPGGLALVFGGETDIFVLSPGPPTAFLLDFSTPRSALPTTVNVEYDEPVFNLTLDELQLVRGATPVTITGGDVVPSDGRRFRFDNLTYASVGEGPHTFSLVPGDVVDGDGNPPSNTSTFDFVIDSTPPSIVSAQLVTASPTTNDFVEVELEWNEPVVDFLFDNQVEKVTTGTAAASVNSIDPVSGSDTRYRITLQASGDGTISVGAVPGATEDLAGNTSATGVFSAPVAVDNTRPFLETFAAAANPTNADPVIYTFGWNETVAGFDAGDITVTPSAGITFTGTEFAQAAAKNTEDCTEHVTAGGVETGANAPEWDETSTNFGTPICDTGLCGTDNPLNGLFWLWFGGTTSPEVSSLSQDVSFPPGTATLSYELIVESVSEATPAQLTVSLGGTILHTETPLVGTIIDTRREIDVSAFADSTTRTLSFDFDNNSSTVITNFFLDDISIQSCPPAESGGSTFTLTINGVQGEFGTLTVDVAGFSVTDAVSQGNLADSDITVIDRQPPGISQILAINSSPTFDDTLAWDVTFAEPVTGFTKEDLLVSAGAATFGDSAVTQLSDFRYSVQLFDVAGGGDVTFTIPADTVQDAAGNGNSVPFTSPVITHILPEITVGSLNLNVSFPSTNGQFTDLGGGNYDIGSGVLINDMVQCNSAIQVRGNTITGNGTIRQFAGQILHDGAYSIDATTGDATITDPVEDKFVWNAVFLGICHFRINANSITLDGWMRHTGLADNGFKGATLSSNHVLTMPGFFLGPDPCDDTGALQFTISSVQLETNQNRFIGVQPVVTGTPFSSISFDQFAVRVGNELTASGSIVKQGHTLPFDSVTANADGMSFNVAYGSPESEGIIATYDNVQITRTGQFNVSGGTLTTEQGGFSGTFSPPVFNGTPQVRTDVTVNTTTAFGTVVLRDIDFDGRPGPDRIAGGPDASVEINGVPFSLPDGGKFFRFAGFSASSATILSLDGIGVNFSSLSVNNDSVAIGGGGYEVLGLSYSFDVTEPEGGNGVSVQGGFGLPDNLGAASGLQLAAAVTILDTPQGPDVQLNGLQFCTPAGPDIKIKKSNFKLPQLCFEYDEGPPEVIAGDVTVGIPEVVDLTAGFGVKGGKLDKISLGVDGLNLAIDSTGAFLQSISGGVENLSRVETTWDEKYFLFLPGAPPLERTERMTGVPPIRVTGTIGASAGPQVLGQALISATVAAMIDETQFRLDGTVTIVIIDVGGGYVHMRWSGPLQGVNVGGHMTYLLVIRGQVDASLDFNGNFRGCASITIRIPDGVPFGGLEFGGVFVCVSAPPFSIRGCVTIIVDLCLTISEDGSISFGKEDSVEPWEVPFWQPIPMDSIDKTTGEPQTVYMYMFSNWVGGEKHYRKDGGFKSSRSGSETRSITLPAGQQAIVRLSYENDGGDPAFNLTSPTGKVFTPEMVPGFVPTETAEAAYFHGTTRREAGYAVRAGEAGDYTVEILNPSSLGNFSLQVLLPETAPFVRVQDVAIEGSNIVYQWTDADEDSDAVVSLGLDTDRFGANGVALLTGISEDDETDMASFDLTTTPVQPGVYWPYAIIEDGSFTPQVAYADVPVFVPDVDASSPIEDFQVAGANGTASVTFTPVNDPDIVSYKLSWTDDPTNWLLVNSTAIPLEENALLLSGLQDNQPYKFVLAAVSFVDSSEKSRATRFALLDDAVKAVAGKAGDSDALDAALAAVRGAAKSTELELSPGEDHALATQAVQVARYAALRPAKTDPRFAEFVVGTDEAAKAAVRSGVLTPRYVDSHFASVDNVILQRASGINNPPRILTKPLANAKAGTVHTQQLVAVDPDTGTATGITFSPVSVPGGFGISSAGLITWDTSTVLTGDYDITIAAADAAGATTHLSWILSVVDVIMPPPFGIASVPDGDVLIGNEWTYAPSLTGTASGIPIAWSLVDGPQGMTIDPQTGAMAWDSTGVTLSAKGNASFRVIIRAEETGGLGRTAIQEFNVDVENRFDSIDIKLQGNRDQWMLF